jgi:hypothetical protein
VDRCAHLSLPAHVPQSPAAFVHVPAFQSQADDLGERVASGELMPGRILPGWLARRPSYQPFPLNRRLAPRCRRARPPSPARRPGARQRATAGRPLFWNPAPPPKPAPAIPRHASHVGRIADPRPPIRAVKPSLRLSLKPAPVIASCQRRNIRTKCQNIQKLNIKKVLNTKPFGPFSKRFGPICHSAPQGNEARRK